MPPRRLRTAALAVLWMLLALHGAALVVRVLFVLRSGPMASTTGFEEFSLYNIWKVVHALPLYEWPQKGNLLLTSYNVGFYEVYGAWARLWGADGPALVCSVRLFTLLCAGSGMGMQVILLRRFAPAGVGVQAWIWGLSFLAWFGTTFTAWSTLSARPDIPAAALALGGLALVLRENDCRDRWLMLGASLLFFAAWSFKQSVAWIFVGAVLQVIFRDRRSWRTVAVLIGPFAGLALLVLATGSDAYRYNLWVVPRIYRWFPAQSVTLLAQAVALNLLFWGLAGWAVAKWLRREPGQPPHERTLAFVALPPVVMGTAQLALHGSGTNNILEGFLMVALLGSAAWLRIWTSAASSRRLAVGVTLAATMIPLPALQLMLAMRGKPYTTVGRISLGNLTKLNSDQLAQRRRFAAWMQTVPRPLWIGDAMLQMPWFANDNHSPAFPRDPQFEADARGRGLRRHGGFAGLIRRRQFAALLLRPGEALHRAARRNGYREVPIPEEFGPILATEFGLDRPIPRLFLRVPKDPAGSAADPPAD